VTMPAALRDTLPTSPAPGPAVSAVGQQDWGGERTEQQVTFPEPEFEAFFHAHYDQLVRSLTLITGDREAARDCVQEAFIKASTRWRKVRRYDNPVGWVRRVAINQGRDAHRSSQRRKRRESLDRVKELEDLGVHRLVVAPPTSNPTKIRQAMEQLAEAVAPVATR